MLCYIFIHSKKLCTNILLLRTLLKQEKIDMLEKVKDMFMLYSSVLYV